MDNERRVKYHILAGIGYSPFPQIGSSIQQESCFLEQLVTNTANIRGAAPHNFCADPDQSYHFYADPDPTFHFHADPDPHHDQTDANLCPLTGLQTLQSSIFRAILLHCERSRLHF
jgi:hypothetical protein